MQLVFPSDSECQMLSDFCVVHNLDSQQRGRVDAERCWCGGRSCRPNFCPAHTTGADGLLSRTHAYHIPLTFFSVHYRELGHVY